mmetsp:Transcript_5139/g.9766  ORF Transcript_5139/g.9766 Transcript_5139/m.9766 type:complete len:447 (+) Transcript_5139:96-1436(+)
MFRKTRSQVVHRDTLKSSANAARNETKCRLKISMYTAVLTVMFSLLFVFVLPILYYLGSHQSSHYNAYSPSLYKNAMNEQFSASSTDDRNKKEHEKLIISSIKDDTNMDIVKTKSWPAWPAVAYEEIRHPLVFKGETFVSKMRYVLLDTISGQEVEDKKESNNAGYVGDTTLLDEFVEVYRLRPDKDNECGIRINHALALFYAVKLLKPTLVVESGINAGQSTYFIRNASPNVKIWALDPLEEPICAQSHRWIDQSGKTTYFVGKHFVDITQHKWAEMVSNKTIDADTTLFFIDDHMHALSRIKVLAKAGMKHVILEDNYKIREGASNEDKWGVTPKQAFFYIDPKRRSAAEWYFQNMVSYAEFPPLIPPIMAKKALFARKAAGGFMAWQDKNEDIVAPILRPDLDKGDEKIFHDIASKLELNPDMVDVVSYKQFMNYNQICYIGL